MLAFGAVAAHAVHRFAAVTAEELSCEEKVLPFRELRGTLLVFGKFFLYCVKHNRVNHGFISSFNADISVFIYAYVFLIAEHCVKAACGEFLAEAGAIAFFVKVSGDIGKAIALSIHSENCFRDKAGCFIDNIFLALYLVADRDLPACGLTF